MEQNAEILKIAQRLLNDQPHLLGEDAEQIAQWLMQTPQHDPEEIRRTANRLLDCFSRRPEVMARVRQALSGDRLSYEMTKGIHLPPGDVYDTPPGATMVCPEPGCQQRRRLRQKGQYFFCPDHKIPLVPETRQA